MSSISPECNEIKKEYDTCFNKWYSEKFLKGYKGDDCEVLFKQYRACVWVSGMRGLIFGTGWAFVLCFDHVALHSYFMPCPTNFDPLI